VKVYCPQCYRTSQIEAPVVFKVEDYNGKKMKSWTWNLPTTSMPTHIFGSSTYTPQRNPPPRNKGLLTIGFPFSEGLSNPLFLCLSFQNGLEKNVENLRTMTFRVLHVQPRPSQCGLQQAIHWLEDCNPWMLDQGVLPVKAWRLDSLRQGTKLQITNGSVAKTFHRKLASSPPNCVRSSCDGFWQQLM